MMEDLTDFLKTFSKDFKLWELTKKYGFKCLENALKETSSEFSDYSASDFVFRKTSQSLVFFDSINSTPYLRTTFYLFLKENNVGYYSLDVDKEATVIDDWLVFY